MMEDATFDWGFCIHLFPLIVGALPATLLMAFVGLGVGGVVALGLVALRRAPGVLAWASRLYVSFFRGTPLLVQLFLLYYGVPLVQHALSPAGSTSAPLLSPLACALVAFSLFASANLAEVFRSALDAVDRGQGEAALSVGMTRWQVFHRIVGPQALVTALPNVGNLFLGLIKGTSLAFTVAVIDVMAVAKIEAADGFRYVEAYLVVSLVYWAVCAGFEALFFQWEKRISAHRRDVEVANPGS
jgi:L-cystine transport system permease protein